MWFWLACVAVKLSALAVAIIVHNTAPAACVLEKSCIAFRVIFKVILRVPAVRTRRTTDRVGTNPELRAILGNTWSVFRVVQSERDSTDRS